MYAARLPFLIALCSALSCALLAACGDDGTDGLSSCPNGIQADKLGVFTCVPTRAGAGGMAGAGRAGGGSQQPKSAAGSGGMMTAPPKPAAGSGAPPVPPGTKWTCVQVNTTCSCVPTPTESDNCSKPRESCCRLVRRGDSYSGCVCYAEDSTECEGTRRDTTTFVPVATCPPPE